MRVILTPEVVCALLCFMGCFTGCGGSEKHETERPHLSVTSPLKKDATILRNYVGQVRSIRHIELRAIERGYLQDVHVDEGQPVKAGDLMFEIMPQVYQAELKHAEAEAQFNQIELSNTQKLADTKVVAPSELALAKAKFDKAQAKVDLAKAHLGFTQIKAPFDGIMGRLGARQGSLLEGGDLLSTLSDNSQMWVYFNVTEAEYIHYKKSADSQENKLKVKLLMADNSLYSYPGEVTAIEADFNNKTGNIAFRATFPNPEGLLRHGQTEDNPALSLSAQCVEWIVLALHSSVIL